MSDINEEQKRLYKRAEENDYNDALWNIEHLGKITDEYRDKYNELLDRNNKAIEYIETIKDNTPSSTRKEYAKMIVINYEDLLDILQGKEK